MASDVVAYPSTPNRATRRWHRAAEWLVFAVPVTAGAALLALGIAAPSVLTVGAVVDVLLERPVPALIGLAIAVVVGLVWTVALAAAVYLDAVAVDVAATDWEPRGAAHAAVILVLPVVALVYLRRRHRSLGPDPAGGGWWFGFPLGTLAVAGPFVAVAWGVLPPSAVLVGPGLALAFFPIAAYRDASHVRRLEPGWEPDPAVHFVVAAVATLFAFPQPAYAGYYLWRRRAAIGGG